MVKERNFEKIWVYDNTTTTAYVYEPTMQQIYKLRGGKYGLIDDKGEEVVPPIYDEIIFTSEVGILKVKMNNKFGYIDYRGENITDIKYDDASDFCDGMAIVNIGGTPNKRGVISGGKKGYINTLGDEVVKVKYDNAFTFIYSKRTGTPAAAMEQVPEAEVKVGFDKVLKCVQETAKEQVSRYQGMVMDALVEEVNEKIDEDFKEID